MPKHEYGVGQYVPVLPDPVLELPLKPGAIHGRWYIVPIALLGYSEGYNSSVEDIYEMAYLFDDGVLNPSSWQWQKRVQKFTKPLHYDYNGKPLRCEECEKWHKLIPNLEDRVMMSAEE